MSDTNGGVSPQTEVVVTPVAAPVAPSSLKPSGGPKTIADVNARIEEALKPVPQKAPEQAPVAVEPPPAEVAAEEPVAVETPVEPEAVAETEVVEPEDAPEEDQGPGPVTPVKSKKLRMNLPENDEVGRLAAAYLHRNRDWSMTQALEAAQKQLGVLPQKQEAAKDAKAEGLPGTVEAVDSALESQEAERSKALIELRFEDVAKFDSNIRRLDRQRAKLEKDGERQQVEQVSAYERGFAASDAKAVELYEFAGNHESAGHKRMLEIDSALRSTNDPLYNDANKPLILAQMVAKELLIAPRRKGAVTPAPAKAAVPVAPAPKKQILPGGGSSTTPPATNQLNAVDSLIQAQRPKTMAALRELNKKLGLPVS